MHASFLIIGGGLSGLAAAIRLARFNQNVLIIEKHSRVGGLNSYYYRNSHLFETGLHAITNFAPRGKKSAPLNRLLRQLKIRREKLSIREQIRSEICFPGRCTLSFSNNFSDLHEEIAKKFPNEIDNFTCLVEYLKEIDPFKPTPYLSARSVLKEYISEPLLVDMILCPLLYYGSSWENDIDFNQFVIMFRSLFIEGMFRPDGSIKNLLDLLVNHFKELGGTIKLKAGVKEIQHHKDRVSGVLLEDGCEITCDYLISTAGLLETRILLGKPTKTPKAKRLSFTENIFQLDNRIKDDLPSDKTIIFFNNADEFSFKKPAEIVDFESGVLCMPYNFKDLNQDKEFIEVRTTHLANYDLWNKVSTDRKEYNRQKELNRQHSYNVAKKIIGSFSDAVVYQDSFTPITIEKFTGKIDGAIYGSPIKAKDGTIGLSNLFIAGTDQGFLGIVGSMLSGVTIVNQNILTKV